jgi:peptide/nickel transport system permease protein
VLAAKTMGVRSPKIILRHVVTNCIGTILVNATFQVADAILVVAALSFLGLGIPPPATNWGSMLSDGLNFTYSGFWWLTYPPGIAIVLTVVAFNLVGDGMRDAFGLDTRRR